MTADDERIARALRELRRRSGQTQEQAAIAASVSPRVFRRVERHGGAGTTLSTVRSVFAAFDARVYVAVWWRGADLDRLLDESHAALVEHVTAVLVRRGWRPASEVTFSEYGERGSIDGFRPGAETRSLRRGRGQVRLGFP